MGKEYLKSALHSFNLAIAVEENENLISSYVGLAMCQFLLGDKENYESSLKKASSTKLKIREKIIAEGKEKFVDNIALKGLNMPFREMTGCRRRSACRCHPE